jgi:hypothetical protein
MQRLQRRAGSTTGALVRGLPFHRRFALGTEQRPPNRFSCGHERKI